MHKRRQTPAAQRAAISRLLSRTEATQPVKLPKLVKQSLQLLHDEAEQRRSSGDGAGRGDASSPVSLRRSMRQGLSESKEQIALQLNAHSQFSYAVARAERADRTDRADRQQEALQAAAEEQDRQTEEKEAVQTRQQKAVAWPEQVSSPPPAETKEQHSPPAPPAALLSASASLLLPQSRSAASASSSYSITAPDPSTLYAATVSKLDQLPLELFDNEEESGDRSGSDWMEYGRQRYGEGAGLPAQALRFDSSQWRWEACRVLSWDAASALFTIRFSAPEQVKQVKRLSLLFDDEDAARFASRLASCRRLREECLSLRRLASFVNSQSAALFSPISSGRLHGIIGRLMQSSEAAVVRRQQSVEKLLLEVKEEYSRCMKAAIIAERRREPAEELRMQPLRLPPQPRPVPPPFLAVVDTGPRRLLPFASLCTAISSSHYSRHSEACAVVLQLHRAWTALSSLRFFDLQFVAPAPALHHSSSASASPSSSSPVFPMTLPDFLILQQQQFLSLRERCQNEWRALLINLVRDRLNARYKLFVSSQPEYEASELRRFLTLTGCMLTEQLCGIMTDSIRDWQASFSQYAQRLREAEDRRKQGQDVLHGCLYHASPAHPPLSASQQPPLFLFRLTLDAHSSDIVFTPPLSSLQASLLPLLALPGKLTSLTHIDSDVVPLLGLPDRSLVNAADMPALQQLIADTTASTAALLAASLVQPEALAALYAPFASSLSDSSSLAAAFLSSPHTLEQTKLEILRYRALATAVEAASPSVVSFPLLSCDVCGLQAELVSRCEEVVAALLCGLEAEMRSAYSSMLQRWAEVRQRLSARSVDVYELSELRRFVSELETSFMASLRDAIAAVQEQLSVLLHFQHRMEPELYQQCLTLPRLPLQLTALLSRVRADLSADALLFSSQLRNEQIDLSGQLDGYNSQVDTFSEYGMGSTAQMEQYGARVEMLNEQLEKAEKLAEIHQAEESALRGRRGRPAHLGPRPRLG